MVTLWSGAGLVAVTDELPAMPMASRTVRMDAMRFMLVVVLHDDDVGQRQPHR